MFRRSRRGGVAQGTAGSGRARSVAAGFGGRGKAGRARRGVAGSGQSWRSGRGAVAHVKFRRGGVRLGQLRRSGYDPVWTGTLSWGAAQAWPVLVWRSRFGVMRSVGARSGQSWRSSYGRSRLVRCGSVCQVTAV